ncbi:50S ribosomal protein L31 [bacterium]|jgi:large subunit ribosomal protein L31|nr:50S ribosomal protein L31 [bacterium]MBT4250885.1 50S ribosomal protein L31 [bacterium]MBT4597598.1 50S ribosomal protein L31 [bacterium]MBT6754063.1 50S ribosomal protein L31 [bacterium]MBT7038093.1 50S ribosomal protein L31 [bacterium]
MKKDIHPKYNDEAEIKCSCGNVIKAGSTLKNKDIEICSACHPFYTGKKKLVDSTGRVDRFKQRMEKFSAIEKNKQTEKKKQVAAKKETEKKPPETKATEKK